MVYFKSSGNYRTSYVALTPPGMIGVIDRLFDRNSRPMGAGEEEAR
jgi:hypothetical protein